MNEKHSTGPHDLGHLIREKIAYCQDPALPFLEDKFHTKVLANQVGVPAVPMLFHSTDPKSLAHFIRTNISTLPDIVIKTNHGSGDVCILKKVDGNTWHVYGKDFDHTGQIRMITEKLVKYFRLKLHVNHSRKEWAVNMIWPKRILVEPFIETNDDYKVIVSGGKAIFTYCSTGRFSAQGLVTGVFDREWRFRGALKKSIDRHGKAKAETYLISYFKKPDNLQSLYDFAERLIPGHIALQRVDFFKTADDAYLLGEINSYSGGGTDMMSLENTAEKELVELALNQQENTQYYNDGKVIYLPRRGNEDESDEQALQHAYMEMINGADIVVHTDVPADHENIRKLVQKQRKNPCSLQRENGSWSWDKLYVLDAAEKNMDDDLLSKPNQ